MDVETLKKLMHAVEKCVEDLSKKSDITPAETKAALDGMQLRDMLRCEIEERKMKEEYSERGYSGYRAVPRHYTMTAYGHPGGYYTQSMSGEYGIRQYPGAYENATEGWYQSNLQPSAYNMDSRSEYSRHSIGDRAVEKLENLMDGAKSEYEREELRKFIRMIRQAAD